MMKLALFDLDHTLLAIDSDYAWGEFLIEQRQVDADHYRRMNDAFYADYQAGQLDPIAYNEFVFEFLTRHDAATLHQLHQQFMQHIIIPAIRDKGRQMIAQHRQQGHQIIGITATSDFITMPIFAELGIESDCVIATQAERNGDRYTGKVKGIPSYQVGKLQRLDMWLNGRTVSESWAYSDSINDQPLLEYATHATAVNPDQQLTALALQRGWAIVDWNN